MNILVVGNVLKDVYINLDSRSEKFEIDQNHTKWLDISFDASEHHFFNRESSLGGAAISFEVLTRMGINATVNGINLTLTEDRLTSDSPAETYRYILTSDNQVSYFVPSQYKTTNFIVPDETYDYIFVDRSAEVSSHASQKINTYLDSHSSTKLILYVRNFHNSSLNQLLPRADLIFYEGKSLEPDPTNTNPTDFDPKKIIFVSENNLRYLDISENISAGRIDVSTHLSFYSIAAATILGSFIIGNSVETSLKMARANLENSTPNSVLNLEELQKISETLDGETNLGSIAANLVLNPKGILAADESGGSIHKKFAELNIPDTYENRRNYRNIFLSAPNLEKYVNGVILFDETTEQQADNGQNFVDYLISRRIIPGIKVDQGLKTFEDSLETYTIGLDNLDERLKKYYSLGLRFAKWRAAFEIRLSESGAVLTPTAHAIDENCLILAEYAKKCQSAGLVPIVEPEIVYNGYYSIEKNYEITAKILDTLFQKLQEAKVDLSACILKVNMILAGKNYESASTPAEVGINTAKLLKEHVPENLAGVVFLSGGQTPEQATKNLAEVLKNGPFPWPVTFSFARALQDPALFAWQGDNANTEKACQAFLDRLNENHQAIIENS